MTDLPGFLLPNRSASPILPLLSRTVDNFAGEHAFAGHVPRFFFAPASLGGTIGRFHERFHYLENVLLLRARQLADPFERSLRTSDRLAISTAITIEDSIRVLFRVPGVTVRQLYATIVRRQLRRSTPTT